jgi:hypothetical protein
MIEMRARCARSGVPWANDAPRNPPPAGLSLAFAASVMHRAGSVRQTPGAMRCFYCGESGKAASNEHVPSQFLGSRLKTRRVCSPCGARIARELDDEVARYPMVLMPKALADVRSVKHQRKGPFFSVAGAVSTTGQAVEVEFSPGGQVARDGTRGGGPRCG